MYIFKHISYTYHISSINSQFFFTGSHISLPLVAGHYVLVAPTPLPEPKLVIHSPEMAEAIMGRMPRNMEYSQCQNYRTEPGVQKYGKIPYLRTPPDPDSVRIRIRSIIKFPRSIIKFLHSIIKFPRSIISGTSMILFVHIQSIK